MKIVFIILFLTFAFATIHPLNKYVSRLPNLVEFGEYSLTISIIESDPYLIHDESLHLMNLDYIAVKNGNYPIFEYLILRGYQGSKYFTFEKEDLVPISEIFESADNDVVLKWINIIKDSGESYSDLYSKLVIRFNLYQ